MLASKGFLEFSINLEIKLVSVFSPLLPSLLFLYLNSQKERAEFTKNKARLNKYEYSLSVVQR